MPLRSSRHSEKTNSIRRGWLQAVGGRVVRYGELQHGRREVGKTISAAVDPERSVATGAEGLTRRRENTPLARSDIRGYARQHKLETRDRSDPSRTERCFETRHRVLLWCDAFHTRRR